MATKIYKVVAELLPVGVFDCNLQSIDEVPSDFNDGSQGRTALLFEFECDAGSHAGRMVSKKAGTSGSDGSRIRRGTQLALLLEQLGLDLAGDGVDIDGLVGKRFQVTVIPAPEKDKNGKKNGGAIFGSAVPIV